MIKDKNGSCSISDRCQRNKFFEGATNGVSCRMRRVGDGSFMSSD